MNDTITTCAACSFSVYRRTDGSLHLVYLEQGDTVSCAAHPDGTPNPLWMEDRNPHIPLERCPFQGCHKAHAYRDGRCPGVTR